MVFRYRVFCWIPPKSGFDLAEHNKYLSQIKKTIPILFNGNKEIEDIFNSINEKYKGMILETLVIDSDERYEDNVEEIESEVQRKYPGSIIVHHEMVDAYKVENNTK